MARPGVASRAPGKGEGGWGPKELWEVRPSPVPSWQNLPPVPCGTATETSEHQQAPSSWS